MDPGGGTKIPRNADPAPMEQPSYKDLVGKLKQQKAPDIGPSSRPRERSPSRGDRRPIDVQRRNGSASLFPGGDSREEALARRNKTIPREAPPPPQQFRITEKRKSETDLFRRNKRPNPAAEKYPSRKRKAEGPPDSEYQQDLRKAPPKPEGRLTSRNRLVRAPKPKATPEAKPVATRNRRNKK
jgi:hypothetical protein